MLHTMRERFCTEVCNRVSSAVMRCASARSLLTCGHLDQPMVGLGYGPGHQTCTREEVRSKLRLGDFWGNFMSGVNSRKCLRPRVKGTHLEHFLTVVIVIVSRAAVVARLSSSQSSSSLAWATRFWHNATRLPLSLSILL